MSGFPYSPVVSEIDDDIEELLLVYELLFGRYCRIRKIEFQHERLDWEYHVDIIGCLKICS